MATILVFYAGVDMIRINIFVEGLVDKSSLFAGGTKSSVRAFLGVFLFLLLFAVQCVS